MTQSFYPIIPPDVPVAAHPPTPAGNIESDTPCRKCSYNLRGLLIDGQCPECATPVRLSTGDTFLRNADPVWLRRLARGINPIFGSSIASIFAFLFAMVAARIPSGARYVQYVYFGVNLFYLYGAWLMTNPDPSGFGEDAYGHIRYFVRIGLILGTAVFLGVPVVSLFARPSIYLLLMFVSRIVASTGTIAHVAFLYYLGLLAMRIDDRSLAERAKFLLYALGSIWVVASLLQSAIVLAELKNGNARTIIHSLPPIFGCFLVIGALVQLIFAIVYLAFLQQLKRAMRNEITFADKIWSVTSTPPPTSSSTPPAG